MIALTDLDEPLQAFLTSLSGHKKISVGRGARDIIVYVANRQLKKQVEAKIPEEYGEQIQVVVSGRIRPAHHEPAPKNPTKQRTPRRRTRP